MESPLYPVQDYPPTIKARAGHDLIAMPLHGEAPCAKCPRSLTIVGYLDRRTRKTWPTCWNCARDAAKVSAEGVMQGPKDPWAFEPYDD